MLAPQQLKPAMLNFKRFTLSSEVENYENCKLNIWADKFYSVFAFIHTMYTLAVECVRDGGKLGQATAPGKFLVKVLDQWSRSIHSLPSSCLLILALRSRTGQEPN